MKVEVVVVGSDALLCTVSLNLDDEALPEVGDRVRRVSHGGEWLISDVDGPVALSDAGAVVGSLAGIVVPLQAGLVVDDVLELVATRRP